MRLPALALLLVALALAQPPAAGQRSDRTRPLRILAFSADSGDAELRASGVAARWAAQGHRVMFVVMTNGQIRLAEDAGPYARRRAARAAECARILGIETQALDILEGELTPSRANTDKVSRLIRQWQPDIVLGHRPFDSDHNHRAAGVLLDRSVGIPPLFPSDAPPTSTPVYLYYSDDVQAPPFVPTMIAGFDDVAEKKWQCIGLPPLEQPDMAISERDWQAWLVNDAKAGAAEVANRYRERLVALYGAERGRKVKYAEAFQLSTYGRQATVDELLRTFPE
jgi:LmbE family N-acetylglucosaminyl deacetylase